MTLPFADLVEVALRKYDDERPRMAHKRAGLLGPSDVGFCRNRALLVTKGTPPSDSTEHGWAAVIGSALGEHVERALKETFPTWLVGSIDNVRATTTVRGTLGDYEISGTPDVVIPEVNTVLDLKTKDGFGWVRRQPWTDSYRYQTWLYAKGLQDAGVLDPTKPVTVGLVFLDRSGKIGRPHVVTRAWDPALENEIAQWIDDVVYARLHNEEASKDIAPPVCERICEFYTVCRGDLPMSDGQQISDPILVGKIGMYREALAQEKAARMLKAELAGELAGVNGTTGQWTVRWTTVEPSMVPGYERAGYERLDVRATPQRGVRE